MSEDAISAAIAAASAQATNPEITEVIEAHPVTSQGVTSYVAAAKPMSLDDAMSTAGLAVDHYLKVNEFGLTIGNLKGMLEQVIVGIQMDKMNDRAFTTIRATAGGNSTYFKTRDGVSCVSGGSWADAVRKAGQIDPQAQPYSSVDLEMVLLEDAVDVKGAVVAPAGKTLGKGLTYTDMKSFGALYSALKTQGKLSQEVKVKVTPVEGTKGTAKYGYLAFELIE